jgi:hypothetical protein
MAPVVATIEVDRAAAEVFAYATDPSRFHEWQKGVTAGHLDQPGEPSVGARCVTTRRVGFSDRPVTSEITCFRTAQEVGHQGRWRAYPSPGGCGGRTPGRGPITTDDHRRL